MVFDISYNFNQTKRIIWLLQKVYITKIFNKSISKPIDRFFTTLIDITELLSLSDKKKVFDISKILFQQKVGSFSFAAVTTTSNIAFVIFKLLEFNQQLGKIYYKVVD